MCERSKAFAYLECSANTREGVKHVFETAVIAALHIKKEQYKKNAVYCEMFELAVSKS